MSDGRLELGIVRLDRDGAANERLRLIGLAPRPAAIPATKCAVAFLGSRFRHLPGQSEGLCGQVLLELTILMPSCWVLSMGNAERTVFVAYTVWPNTSPRRRSQATICMYGRRLKPAGWGQPGGPKNTATKPGKLVARSL